MSAGAHATIDSATVTERKSFLARLFSPLVNKLSPSPWVRRRILARVEKRQGSSPMPYTLVYRKIFILPTGFGVGFGLLLILTALGGLNFNNNLALLLVFVIGAAAQLTTHFAYRNLAGLEIQAVTSEPVFAGDKAHFLLHLENTDDRPRYSIAAATAAEPRGDCGDLPARGRLTLELSSETEVRGWLHAPALRLETRYPMGLFRAWSWLFPSSRCLVYPRPANDVPPLPTTGEGQSGDARKGEGDQVHGLRNYRPGDPLKHIAWRTSARHDQLYSREMESPRDQACVLSFQQLDGRSKEDRLQILTAWVLMAEHRQLSYKLELPHDALGPASGPAHRSACLEALALFP